MDAPPTRSYSPPPPPRPLSPQWLQLRSPPPLRCHRRRRDVRRSVSGRVGYLYRPWAREVMIKRGWQRGAKMPPLPPRRQPLQSRAGQASHTCCGTRCRRRAHPPSRARRVRRPPAAGALLEGEVERLYRSSSARQGTRRPAAACYRSRVGGRGVAALRVHRGGSGLPRGCRRQGVSVSRRKSSSGFAGALARVVHLEVSGVSDQRESQDWTNRQ